MNQNRINNKQILSAEEMKNKIIRINNSFNNYIKSLIMLLNPLINYNFNLVNRYDQVKCCIY